MPGTKKNNNGGGNNGHNKKPYEPKPGKAMFCESCGKFVPQFVAAKMPGCGFCCIRFSVPEGMSECRKCRNLIHGKILSVQII